MTRTSDVCMCVGRVGLAKRIRAFVTVAAAAGPRAPLPAMPLDSIPLAHRHDIALSALALPSPPSLPLTLCCRLMSGVAPAALARRRRGGRLALPTKRDRKGSVGLAKQPGRRGGTAASRTAEWSRWP